MNVKLIITAACLVVLLVLSALFSAAETALTSIPKVQYRKLKKSADAHDRILVDLLSDPPRIITTLLIGNNLVNILSSSIATAFAMGVFGDSGVGIATLVMTVLIIVFSEITPKTLAAGDPVTIAARLAPAIRVVRTALRPVVTCFNAVNLLFIGILKRLMTSSAHRLTEDEIRTMMDVGKKEGVLENEEHALLNRAFEFTDLTLREIMTPRTSIVAVSLDAGIDELVSTFRKYRFSRLPVYDDTIDSIRGMIHYKDLLFMERGKEATRQELENLVRPVLFVPETQTTTGLLGDMDRNGQNLAIVLDEHGSTSGLITIDDAIGAVFGGIRDEYDKGTTEPADLVQVIASDHIRVPGNLKLTDLNAFLKTSLNSEYYETVGGFVMEKAGKLPAKGDQIRYGNFVFLVDEVAGRMLQRIDIRENVREP